MRRLPRARASSGLRRAPLAVGLAAPAVAWGQGPVAGAIDSVWMLLAWLVFGLACAALGALWARRGLTPPPPPTEPHPEAGPTAAPDHTLPAAALRQALGDGALLAQLWPQLDLAAAVLEDTASGHWRVQRASPGLGHLLQVDAASLVGQDWPPLCARLPAPLGEGLVGLEAGQSRELGPWRARLQSLALPAPAPPARLLTLQARPDPPSNTAADERDQESFIYSISHDLRAPIRVVEGFSRILKEDYGRFLDRIGNDHLDRVLAAAARMHSMIDALLALSRLQSQPLVRKPVDLSQLAVYVMEDLRREQPERAAEVRIEPGLVVHGDPTLLRMALENLLGNAWKYSGQSPVTHIELRRETQDGRTVYVVADRGAGFDMRFADRLFGVFQRLHSAKDFQGTGVGLASVRRIVRRHGGDIWAESEVGQGARFYFTLAP